MASKPRVVIMINDGNVQEVISDTAIEYLIVDQSPMGADPEDLVKINGEKSLCFQGETEKDKGTTENLFDQFEQPSGIEEDDED